MDKLNQLLKQWAGGRAPDAETIQRLELSIERQLQGLGAATPESAAAWTFGIQRSNYLMRAAGLLLLAGVVVAVWMQMTGGLRDAARLGMPPEAPDAEAERPYLTHSLTDAEVQALIQRAVSPHVRPLKIEYELIKRARRELRWENKAIQRAARTNEDHNAEAPATDPDAWPSFRPLVIDVPPPPVRMKDDGSSEPRLWRNQPSI